jgi:hypothetical protein
MHIRALRIAFFLLQVYHMIASDSHPERINMRDRGLKWKGLPKHRNVTQKQEQAVLVGDTMTLKCRKALEIEKITWHLNQTIELTKKHLRSTSGQRILLVRSGKELDFSYVLLQDSGNYSCVSDNITRHVFLVDVDDIHSLTDLRSPFNCLLLGIFVVLIIFVAIWVKRKLTKTRQRDNETMP